MRAKCRALASSPVLADNPNFTLGLLEGNAGQLWIQVIAVAATIAWCAIATYVLLKLIDLAIGLRVDRDADAHDAVLASAKAGIGIEDVLEGVPIRMRFDWSEITEPEA